MEYRIGKVGTTGGFPQKYIVAKIDGAVRFFASSEKKTKYHRDIASLNKIDERYILGGGKICMIDDDTMEIFDCSTDFGGVPEVVLNLFVTCLQKEYAKKLKNKNLTIKVGKTPSYSLFWGTWQDFGFSEEELGITQEDY